MTFSPELGQFLLVTFSTVCCESLEMVLRSMLRDADSSTGIRIRRHVSALHLTRFEKKMAAPENEELGASGENRWTTEMRQSAYGRCANETIHTPRSVGNGTLVGYPFFIAVLNEARSHRFINSS